MLALLLDEQISPKVVARVLERAPSIPIQCLATYREGALLGAPDALVLRTALRDGLTLVTYDVTTIPPILREMAEAGESHAGVIFVSSRTLPPSQFHRLAAALVALHAREAQRDWVNRTVFLQPG